MEKQIKISVIIPVFNVAEYLRRSLDSCVYQTLHEIEIIVINDCSPDPRDTEIMQEYAQRYPTKIRLIFHEKNKGRGAARNSGILAARGEFIQFVDADDFIDLNTCKKAYNVAKSECADMCLFNMMRLFNGVADKFIEYRKPVNNTVGAKLAQTSIYSCVRLIISRNLLVTNDLFFPEGIVYEDFFCCLYYVAARKIAYAPDFFYHYCQRLSSICNTADQTTRFENQKMVFDCIKFTFNSNFFSQLEEASKQAVFVYVFNSFSIFDFFRARFLNQPDRIPEYRKKVCECLETYAPDYEHLSIESDKKICETLNIIKLCSETQFNDEDFLNALDKLFFPKKNEFINNLDNQVCVVWGAGVRGKRLIAYLGDYANIELVDEDPELYGLKIEGLEVKPWETVKLNTANVVVSPKGQYETVKTQIHNENPNIKVYDHDDVFGY
jgi:glycosyltransferase involved in cell wall biosynthesis